MRKFELWLDESGDFENDNRKTGAGVNPSLIGGLLIENNTFPDSFINAILPESGTYHSVDENDQLDRFRLIDEKLFKNAANRIVVFSNQERIMVLDNNLTYLNIISEGILQLIKRLKAQYGEISLKAIIANRVNTTTGLDPSQSVVPVDEYVNRLSEKLIIGGAENAISNKEWELTTSSARKDKRLMLADIICNTFYTRYRKRKFSESEQEYIESIYTDENKTLIFTVFESILEKNFKNNLIENRIGEAVASICLSNNAEALDRCFSLLKLNFLTCGVHDITFQYEFIKAYIDYHISVVRDFDQCKIFLNNLLVYYIPLLEENENAIKGSYAQKLALDIKFYLYTVQTHVGNVKAADELENECENLLKEIPNSFENVSYKLKFKTRKITNLINAFEFDAALTSTDKQIQACRDIKTVLDLTSQESENHYDELAKTLGTRVQIVSFLLRNKPDLYQSGVENSDEAINEFTESVDIQRQFLYRVQLETEHGSYDLALDFLKKAAGVNISASIKELWQKMESGKIFGVNAYIRLMAEADRWDTAEEMYKLLSNAGYIQRLSEQGQIYHPVEIIFWKYAYYCAKHGMISAAIKSYAQAIEISFAEEDITLNIIGLGIYMEELSVLIVNQKKDFASAKKQFNRKWMRVQELDYKGILPKVFGDINMQSEDADYFRKLSRRITY